MHILDLDPARRDALYVMNSPMIRPIVRMRVFARAQTGTTAGGFPIYSNTFDYYDFNISDRLLERVNYSMQKPRFGGDEQFDGLPIDVDLTLLNSDGYLATFQNGYGIRAEDIEQGEVRIYSNIGVGNPIEMFQGRIIGRPTESKGRSIIKVRGSLWDALRKPVLYEQFQGMWASSDGVEFYTTPFAINCVGGHFCAYHGIVKWDSNGRPKPAFKQEQGQISLTAVGLTTGLKPGTYRIEFRDSKNYTITYPSNETFQGSITTGTAGGGIYIPPQYWIGTDGTDTIIEFEIGVCYKGNPVAIAYNLLEKGLLDNWGALPQQVPSVRIDWPKFEELAQRFESFTVFVDAGNSDNKVWNNTADNLPLDTASLAQWVLKHINCTLSLTADGLITIIGPYIDDNTVWPVKTESDILVDGITIEGTDEVINFLTLQYGYDTISNTYGATWTEDMRIDPNSRKVELVSNAQFYKYPTSTQEARWLAETMRRRHFDGRQGQTVISFSMTPNMGLTLLPGDIVRVVSTQAPIVSTVVEIISIGIEIGGEVQVKAATVQQIAEGPVATLCASTYGNVSLW